MDESTQQAVSIGVNALIFVIALTITISLVMSVKNVAEKAYEFDASLPSGSRTLEVEEENKRVLNGYELISYYASYMTNVNNTDAYMSDLSDGVSEPKKTDNFHIIIENRDGTRKIDEINTKTASEDFYSYFRSKGIDLDNKYELLLFDYDKEENFVTIKIKEI